MQIQGKGVAATPRPVTCACRSALAFKAARALTGAPFVHAGRGGRRGVDCVGLALAAAEAVAAVSKYSGVRLTHYDVKGYARGDGDGMLRAILERHLIAVAVGEAWPGDIMLMHIAGAERHVGIAGGMVGPNMQMVHAYEGAGGVSEHRAGMLWERRVRGVFRLAFLSGSFVDA